MANRIVIGVLALVAIGSLTFVIVGANSHQNTPAEVRINARPLADGRVEFALQQRKPDGSWGDRQLPRVRKLPANAQVDRWLSSSPVSLAGYLTLPIQSAGRFESLQVSRASVTIFAEFNEFTGVFTTRVDATGVVEPDGISNPTLAFSCVASDGTPSTFDAYAFVPRREHPESDIVFTAWRYETDRWGHLSPDTVAEKLQWDYEAPEDWVGSGWAITQEQMEGIKDFHLLSVAYYDFGAESVVAYFDLNMALNTPVQANLDHCGDYTAEYGYELTPIPEQDGH